MMCMPSSIHSMVMSEGIYIYKIWKLHLGSAEKCLDELVMSVSTKEREFDEGGMWESKIYISVFL